MKKNLINNIGPVILSIVFSVSLLFAFTEIPRVINHLLSESAGFPGFDPGTGSYEQYKNEIFISAYGLRWIGWGSLFLIVFLTLLGFITKRSGWALGGAALAFLPVFGGFALGMFYLAGLGLLRAGFIPALDIYPRLLDMANIVYLPYWILIRFFYLFGWFAHDFLAWFFMSLGAMIFTWGVFSWIKTRIREKGVATGFLYRFSRHPQYLGWMIWSYGYFLFTTTLNNSRKSWGFSPALSWLIMTTIIIAVCMLEELKMEERYGNEYEAYRQRTPFLFPVPEWIKRVLKAPVRLIIRKQRPSGPGDIAIAAGLFFIVSILLSIPFMSVNTYGYPRFHAGIRSPATGIPSVLEKIRTENSRRVLSQHFSTLESYGIEAIPHLMVLARDTNNVRSTFAVGALGRLKAMEAIPLLIEALDGTLRSDMASVIIALGSIGSSQAEDPLLRRLERERVNLNRQHIYASLGNLGSEKAWDKLTEGVGDTIWYCRGAALRALASIDPVRSEEWVLKALKDSDERVVRTALDLVLVNEPPNAIPCLEPLSTNSDYEIRFYSRQAIKKIRKKR